MIRFFEVRTLGQFVRKLGFGRRYVLENLMKQAAPDKTITQYDIKNYFQNNFLNKRGIVINSKTAYFRSGLEFINKEIKRCTQISESDFVVGFLEQYYNHSKVLINSTNSLYKQNVLIQFILSVEYLIKQNLVEEQYFKNSMILMVIYVLKIGIEDPDLVEHSIFSMQLILNAIGLSYSLPYLNRFLALAVQAYLKFPDKSKGKVKKYTQKILEFYIKQKTGLSQAYYKDLQFLHLNKIKDNEAFCDIVKIITCSIYCTEEKVAQNLQYLISQIKTGNEDTRLLNVSYILELLEQQDIDEVRKVLMRPDILKYLYQQIISCENDYKTEKGSKLLCLCGKVVAAIGLCQPFVNDVARLKATNQQTLMGEFEPAKANQDTDLSLLRSDFYNPLTNMKYREKAHQSGQDNILEVLAVPTLNELQIERENIVKFADQLLLMINQLSNISDQKPQQFYYSMYLIEKFKGHYQLKHDRNLQPAQRDQLQIAVEKQGLFAATIFKYNEFHFKDMKEIDYDDKNKSRLLKIFSKYLIYQVQDQDWNELLRICIPVLANNEAFLYNMLPYLVYYAIRFNKDNKDLVDKMGRFFNYIFESQIASHIQPLLQVQDFLKVCLNQDKKIFKQFIENDTKFKYVEKLFQVDTDTSKIKDQNVLNFLRVVEANVNVRYSFLAVKKIKNLLTQIDKLKKIKAARQVKNYQRCIYSFEDHYRVQNSQANTQGKSFIEILTNEEAFEIVNLNRALNREDFDRGIFDEVLNSYKAFNEDRKQEDIPMDVDQKNEQIEEKKQNNKAIQQKLDKVVSQMVMIDYWQNNEFEKLIEWSSEINFSELNELNLFLRIESDRIIQKFEMLICLFAAEYYKGLKCLLQNDDNLENPGYLQSLENVQRLLKLLYCELVSDLNGSHGERAYQYKLFLHILYELDSAVHYFKDVFLQERDKIQEILKREVNREKRRFEKIYYEFDMNHYFEKFLSWLEERSSMIQGQHDSLMLIYYCRKMIFKMFDRENEYAYYLMRLAKIHRKTSTDIIKTNNLFKDCEQMQHKIIDYEYEYAKYKLKTQNPNDAYTYLISKLDVIKQKCDEMYKATKFQWMPKRIYEKAYFMSVELVVQIDPTNSGNMKKYDDFVKSISKNQWEKPVCRYAQYLDELDQKNPGFANGNQAADSDPKKRTIQKIFYYVNSLKHGHKFIWQSFPRALELWFDYNEKEKEIDKINNFMKVELNKLELFKIASVLQILLSRYGHQVEPVRDIIMGLLCKLACEYPGQSAWWIYQFYYFESDTQTAANQNRRQNQNVKQQSLTRKEFAQKLLAQISNMNPESFRQITEGERIFIELKKLSEKQPSQQNQTTMEISTNLQKIEKSTLVMPIQENLAPQIPSKDFLVDFIQTCISQTTLPIREFNQRNADISKHYSNFEAMAEKEREMQASDRDPQAIAQTKFHAYKDKPVLIQGFLQEAVLMCSKEKPKKIGIIGTNKKVYNFLLKCDKYGDLRKEQRFIEFAQLCNKMLENDVESRKRNLTLRTNAIVPLSRNSGMIEWIQNTSTLKSIVGECWKKNNYKGEMNEIKQKAQQMKKGETHTEIWGILKEEIKPVLGSWMLDTFPNPLIWYEARMNFIRTTAIWSIIGYIIGLGDRHGDNILIHNHTGEVTHVDFDCIFEKGAKLKVPEIVPFRLTTNILDAFGIFKEKGVFQSTCEVVLRVLRKNQKNIISFLESFVHDPLIESQNNIKVDVKYALDVVNHKLLGQMNGERGGSITIEDQVNAVIWQALNDEALSKMFIGWMPWL